MENKIQRGDYWIVGAGAEKSPVSEGFKQYEEGAQEPGGERVLFPTGN